MPAATVVVVGSVNTDYVLHVSQRPRPGETVTGARLEIHPGGKGANQAVAAARSGAVVDLIGRVGDDADGRGRLAGLAAEGVGTRHVSATAGTATGTAFITVTPDGENAVVVAPGANARLMPDDVDRAAELLRRASVLVVQLEIPVAAVARAIELAGSRTSVVLNTAPFLPLPPRLLARVDVLVANAQEAAALVGGADVDEGSALATAAAIRGLGPKVAVVTLGPLGGVLATDAGQRWVRAPEVEVVDTTGAGDALVGALAARLAAGADPFDALRFGIAVGSATVTTPGPAPPPPSVVRLVSMAERPDVEPTGEPG